MSASATWKQSLRLTARKASAHWPGIAQLRRRLYEARFRAGKYHCGYSGRFAGFEAAERALPTGLAGFDHDAMADIGHYTTMAGGIEPMPATEYPVLFWLRAALDERARTLLDLGGYVGHAFRQYDRYLAFLGKAAQPRCALPSGVPCRNLFGALLPAGLLKPCPRIHTPLRLLHPAEPARLVSSAHGAPPPWEDGVTPTAPMSPRGLGA